jgi:hypothetical protein
MNAVKNPALLPSAPPSRLMLPAPYPPSLLPGAGALSQWGRPAARTGIYADGFPGAVPQRNRGMQIVDLTEDGDDADLDGDLIDWAAIQLPDAHANDSREGRNARSAIDLTDEVEQGL